MKKFLKLLFIIFLLVILGMISLYNAIFGSISANLKNITSTEKNDILTIIGVDNIELEKLEIPKNYKDLYYTIYFSMDINNDKELLNNTSADDIYREFYVIKKNKNTIKYRCVISDMGNTINTLEQILYKYNK